MKTRRELLRLFGGAAMALPFVQLALGQREALAGFGRARRFIVLYFPDGVAGPSQNGDQSRWHATGSQHDFHLPELLDPLGGMRDRCVFLNGLSLGPTDSGSHPGGAKKLLTGVDGGNGESIDQHLARTVGAGAPHRLLYLGSMANHNNASGDKHISYTSPGATIAPEDDPLRAFERLFGNPLPPGQGRDRRAALRISVMDGALADLRALRGQLGSTEARKLDQHLESLREVELRIKADSGDHEERPASCDDPQLDTRGVQQDSLYDASRFPDILRLQIDLMVTAMSCGLSQVGVLQASHHTSELIMSRFPGTAMHDPGYDMRSHQASHYGASHDPGHREFAAFVQQRRWFVSQFRYLLEQLAARPEGDGTMLDNSLVLLCSEVCDGNTHIHDNMPFVLGGSAGGCLPTGRLMDFGYRRHSDLLVSIARAMGSDLWNFGQASDGGLPGLLS
jgi:hypothetical protein